MLEGKGYFVKIAFLKFQVAPQGEMKTGKGTHPTVHRLSGKAEAARLKRVRVNARRVNTKVLLFTTDLAA